ncbi:unnamed protein product [Nezara viridula]|uniref:Carboxypeptidase n=1 Tax=Nezara viridula TaxID=85310 RepID=A0A9P0EC73_NEZVI|nr:unnamed protein product [Nezara viridula]
MNRWSVLLTFLCSISGYVSYALLNPYPEIRSTPFNGDAGEPLFLTPYIEGGKIQEGQAAAEVKLPGTNVISYSGYLTVNKTFNSNLFFWFFPSEKDPKNAPVVLWLQGGPGGSSLFGLFCENGPFFVDKNITLKERQYSWSRLFNVIYIDNPVGTGFSFTDNDAGYATDQVKVGNDLYSALLQFFQLFPHLQKNEFYISGESYAGKFVPAIGYTIHNNNKINKQNINLKGLAIGNGFTDPENMMVYSDFLFQLGLVDSNTRDMFKQKEAKTVEHIKQQRYSEALGTYLEIFGSLSPGINAYNYVQIGSFIPREFLVYLQTGVVRKSIHVGSRIYHNDSKVKKFLSHDIMRSVKPWVEVLLDHYRVMFYNGQLDISVAYPLTANFLPKLNWTGSEEYRTAPRKEWKVEGELAGFYKISKGLTEVLVRNAGHMVPMDQPNFGGYVSYVLLNPYPKIPSVPFNGNAGKPLFLTPYIEGGRIQAGQEAGKVKLPGTNVTSYSGYLTVNKNFNSNLFFWYFPSEADLKNAPVVLWLQGGPGGSSLFGLFCENGPFFVDKNLTLKERQYSWSRLFNLFPYLQKNEFYISGESYAGKFVPAIGYTIHNNNKINKHNINLKGLAIGNGFTDPENMMVYSDFLFQLGLVDSNTRDMFKQKEAKTVEHIKLQRYSAALGTYLDIFGSLSPDINAYNYVQIGFFIPREFIVYLQTDVVRKSIHVGSRIYHNESKVKKFLRNDIMRSVKPWVEVLLDHYRVMFYNGQLDISVAYPLTANFLPKLNWTGSEDYRTAPRKDWKADGELAGFYKKAKTLTEVLVRDAGHIVPMDQPKCAFDLITRFIYNKFK